jgi:hypothetical protein
MDHRCICCAAGEINVDAIEDGPQLPVYSDSSINETKSFCTYPESAGVNTRGSVLRSKHQRQLGSEFYDPVQMM